MAQENLKVSEQQIGVDATRLPLENRPKEPQMPESVKRKTHDGNKKTTPLKRYHSKQYRNGLDVASVSTRGRELSSGVAGTKRRGEDYDELQRRFKEMNDPGGLLEAAEKVRINAASRTQKKKVRKTPPKHAKKNMDEGVPVKQWMTLLMLCAVGYYMFRGKPFAAGSSKDASKNKVRRNGKQKSKKTQSSKSKSKERSARKNLTLAEEDLVAALVDDAPQKKMITPSSTKRKTSARKRNKKGAAAKKLIPVDDDESHESPDSISTDGSSCATDHNPHEESHYSGSFDEEGWQAAAASTSTDSDDGDWKTVSSARVAPVTYKLDTPQAKLAVTRVTSTDISVRTGDCEAEKATQNPTPDAHLSAQEPDISIMHDEVSSQIELAKPHNGVTENSEDMEPATKNLTPPKVLKDTSSATDVVPTEEDTSATTDKDEAFAIKLQREEEKLGANAAKQTADEWEEVLSKNKKKKKTIA